MKKTATKKDSQEESVKETKKTTKKTIKKASPVAAEEPAQAAEASPEEGKVEIVQRYSKEELEEFRQIIEGNLPMQGKTLNFCRKTSKASVKAILLTRHLPSKFLKKDNRHYQRKRTADLRCVKKSSYNHLKTR